MAEWQSVIDTDQVVDSKVSLLLEAEAKEAAAAFALAFSKIDMDVIWCVCVRAAGARRRALGASRCWRPGAPLTDGVRSAVWLRRLLT